MRRLFRVVIWLSALSVLLAVGAGAAGLYVFWHYGQGLPDYQQLANYKPPVTSRVHAGDGRLIGEFARERRLFVPVDAMPERVVQAFLAAEDKNFYSHPGVDITSIARAVVQNVAQMGQNRRPVGASTITQQVAKNFLIGNEVSLGRKVREAILAFRIEKAFSKDHILELYLNEIYLGASAYGVAAAALIYFDKPLDQLTVAEAAYLAALPKAPNNYHPVRHNARAKERRDWVIDRMAEERFITAAERQAAQAEPLAMRGRGDVDIVRADYFVEEVRRTLLARYGERDLYEGGLSIRSTLDTRLQAAAERALRAGLLAYDRKHGWRGATARIDDAVWQPKLAQVSAAGWPDTWRAALVRKVEAERAEIAFADASTGRIALEDARWARRNNREDQTLGPPVRAMDEVLKVGDVIAVEPVGERGGAFALRQVPEVGGALVAMDPHTGRVLAMAGGWDFRASQFNRATQAQRQPGSSFKPFVYLAALDRGFTPSSLVLDAPFVLDPGPNQPKWKPGNYSGEFYGPSTLRTGIEKSRNLMTVRLAQAIGMEPVVETARRFGIVDRMEPYLPMALGAAETTVLKMTTGYAELVNGGRKITPTLVDRIQDRTGRTVYRHDGRTCAGCAVDGWQGQAEPVLPDERERIADAGTAYQMVNMLQGVVDRGTGAVIRAVGKPLAGKTGTSNDYFDNWFVGFSPDLAVGVFIGFDTPRSLGRNETGASTAAPVFRDFMAEALKDQPATPFRIPPGIRLVRVSAESGLPAQPGERNVVLEAFKAGTEPTRERMQVLDGSDNDELPVGAVANPRLRAPSDAGVAPTAGTGGLY